MNAVAQILRELESTSFYGTLEFKFEAGRVVLLRKTETIKPAHQSYQTSRGNYDDQHHTSE